MRHFFNLIIDFLFPPSGYALQLRAISPENVNRELPSAPAPSHPFITSLFAYKSPLVSELIWSIKYKRDRHAVELGGYALYNAVQEKCRQMHHNAVILIPIPISKKRRKERGYNQTELLIDEIMRLDKEGKFEKRYDILSKHKHTERQTLKNRKERIESMDGIFHAQFVQLNHSIILIDDVTTTGSTLKAARGTLLQAGYSDVAALTVAH